MSQSGGASPVTTRQRQLVERALGEQSDVAGRVVVVTGGVRDIVRSRCEGLLRAGAKVVAADMRWDDDADDFRKQLEPTGESWT